MLNRVCCLKHECSNTFCVWLLLHFRVVGVLLVGVSVVLFIRLSSVLNLVSFYRQWLTGGEWKSPALISFKVSLYACDILSHLGQIVFRVFVVRSVR